RARVFTSLPVNVQEGILAEFASMQDSDALGAANSSPRPVVRERVEQKAASAPESGPNQSKKV
ncbi:MAG: hypothetical protein J2P41_18055, partial [Blastocatellia bacterium]|nr:hypothetical protein [Blastocatellia bacterium]